tara:strand:+ start:1444 stop:2166 length:723 start_codon:yes stop_codon:yes gene_type:complete
MIDSIKKILKSNKYIYRRYLNYKNYTKLKSNLKISSGQVVETNLKFEIQKLLNSNNFQNIVEIGTWNGLGSTKMIIDLVKNRKSKINFFSVESDKLCYKTSKKNLKFDLNFVKLVLGRVYEMDDLRYVTKDSIYDFGYDSHQYEWWIQDLRRYKKTQNIIHKLPSKIDILLLDGGEFSTYADFLVLHTRSNYLILDDTKTYKQYHVLNFIKDNIDRFELILNLDIRNGVAIYKYLGFNDS